MSTEEPGRDSYEYGEREVAPMPERSFRFGEGRISAAIALLLGILCFGGALAWRFPEVLTTRELREIYDVDLLRTLLRTSMWVAIAFGVFGFVRSKGRFWAGALGVLLALGAYFVGGELKEHAVHQVGPGVGLDWMVLDLLKSTVIFIFLEKAFPKYRDQPILRPEWKLDLGYFALNHLAFGVILIIANGFAPSLFGWAVNDTVQEFVSGIWLPAQVLLLMFCADFVQYWLHRAYHEIPWLWGLHAVHHSAEHIDWLAGSRTHIIQTIVDRSLVMVPLYLLGPDTAALNIYVIVIAFQAVLIHSNFGVPFGPLGYIFVTPKFHHWHHSKDQPAIDTNYAAHLSILDKIFGTFHMPDEHWPKEYGTLKRLPRTFLGQLVYPFKLSERRLESSQDPCSAKSAPRGR